jgi:hypothetical protein
LLWHSSRIFKLKHLDMRRKAFLHFIILTCCYQLDGQGISFDFVKGLGGDDQISGTTIVADSANNIYLAGAFQGTVDFDPGAGEQNLTSTGLKDIFFSKFSPSGDLIWVKKMGSTADDTPNEIILNHQGQLYITGGFHFTVDFDPGAGYAGKTATQYTDVFIAKYDTSGNYIWAETFGGNGEDMGRSIALDKDENVYVTGQFAGSIFLGTDVLSSSGPIIYADIFVCRLDAAGNIKWAKGFGDSAMDIGYQVETDTSGDIYVSGQFQTSVDFDPGAGFTSLTSQNNSVDIFIAKYDSLANLIFAKQIPGYGFDMVNDMKISKNGSMLLSGYFEGEADFDPGDGIYTLTSQSSTDGFILQLDAACNFVWVKQFFNVPMGKLAIDNTESLYVSGGYYETPLLILFGETQMEYPNLGYTDLYIVKYNASGDLSFIKTINGAMTESSMAMCLDVSNNLLLTGQYIGTVDFDPGSKASFLSSEGIVDAFFLKFNACEQTFLTIEVIDCDSVTVNDKIYYESGNYVQYLENASGCDSVLSLNVTVNNPSFGAVEIIECSEYTSPSGNYTWTETGIYDDTIPNVVGCDSIIIIDLTIPNINISVTQDGNNLIADQTGVDYQWIDCNNGNTPIVGETNQTFIATTSGNYAVELTSEYCTNTSTCINVNAISLDDTSLSSIRVFPNPSNDFIHIETEDSGMARIYSSDSRLIGIYSLVAGINNIQISTLRKGIYAIIIEQGRSYLANKLVID